MTTTYKGSGITWQEGQEIKERGAGAKWSIDCPKCRHGTLDPIGVLAFVCIDCGQITARAELITLGVIKKKPMLK